MKGRVLNPTSWKMKNRGNLTVSLSYITLALKRGIHRSMAAGFIFSVICNIASAATDLPGNNIHNFSNKLWDKRSIDYALPALHARELGYRYVTIGKPDYFGFDSLQIIKLSNAYYLPMRVNIKDQTVRYISWIDDGKGGSLLRDNRFTHKWYKFDGLDLKIAEAYGCRRNIIAKFESILDLPDIKKIFYTDFDYGFETNIIYNFQSKFAVRKFVEYVLHSYSTGNYSVLFMDDLSREIPGCANKDAGNEGSYPSWKEGQKDFLVKIVAGLKQSHEGRDLIFGNVWHPLSPSVAKTYLKWFADGSLKFDHYYLEAGPQKNLSIKANGTDPRSGLPAYVSSDGYLPADRVSISTSHGWYGSQISDQQNLNYKSGREEYLGQHYYVARVSALQGSWFGWYGENNVDTRQLVSDTQPGSLVHTNDMQLLRVIPGWDNLSTVALAERIYDFSSQSYRSNNSYFSPSIIYARHYKSGELFAVFKKKDGEIKLLPNEIISEAWFSNHYFKRTDESALSCIKQISTRVLLVCESALDRGIRISFEPIRLEKAP
jgi:hypothetical protein